MSSMSPVFLMAIATDSVHIFNEFAFRFGELRDKRKAVFETMAVVAQRTGDPAGGVSLD